MVKSKIAMYTLAVLLAAGCATRRADFREVIRETTDRVFPSLVYVRVVCEDLSSGKNERHEASGSGVVVSEDGEVLTNHHVVDKATEIRCLLSGGESCTAKVIGFDKDMDIALLRLERPAGAPRWRGQSANTSRIAVMADVSRRMGLSPSRMYELPQLIAVWMAASGTGRPFISNV